MHAHTKLTHTCARTHTHTHITHSFPSPIYFRTLSHSLTATIVQSDLFLAATTKPLTMSETLRTLVQEEGPVGLYRGLVPNFLKVIPAVSIGYVVYEQVKQMLGVTSVK